MRKRLLAALAAPVLAATAWLAIPAGTAAAAACGSGGTTWQLGTETVGTTSVQVLDNANNWNGGNACLKVSTTNGVDWTLLSQTITGTSLPVAFPDTNIGCEGGACTLTTGQRQHLPAAASSVTPMVTATWTGADFTAGHEWDRLIDVNASADCSGSASPVVNANIGIYLDAVKNGVHGAYTAMGLADSTTGPVFTDTSGKAWWTKQVTSGGVAKTEFTAQVTGGSVTKKSLHQFINFAATHGTGYMPAGDCLTDFGVGNETWTAVTASTLKMSNIVLDP